MTNINRLYTIIILCISQTIIAKGQTNIGVDAGITFNRLHFKLQNNNLALASRQGYIININVDHELTRRISVEASPGIIQKNYTIKSENNIYQNIDNTYLNIPISIKFVVKSINRLNISGSAGGYYAYWTKSKIGGIAPNVFETTSNPQGEELVKVEDINETHVFTKQDHRNEIGWVAKIGINYKILSNLSCSIKGQYYRSLTDQQKQIDYQAPRYNETLAATIGVVYSLK